MALHFGGPGVTPSNKLGFGNRLSLASGETWVVSPAGPYMLALGSQTCLQVLDPILQTWLTIATDGELKQFESDGVNYRLANLSGCTIGALTTNKGSGYTSAPSVTISSQNSIWRAVLGPYVNTVTVSNGGSNYTYPPAVTFSAPAAGGIPATGYATLSGGAVSTITVVNQGGGYTTPPTVSLTNDPREGLNNVTAGYGATAVCSLTGSGTVAGIICVDPGSGGLTSVPTFTFSGGGGTSVAATVICDFTITAFTPGGTNTGWGTTTYNWLSAMDGLGTVSTASAATNPAIGLNLLKSRMAQIMAYSASGSLANSGSIFNDGGVYSGTALAPILASGGTVYAATTISFTLGGITDTCYIAS